MLIVTLQPHTIKKLIILISKQIEKREIAFVMARCYVQGILYLKAT